MLHKLKKQAQGFTIIEVLIVLAIAGLILLIVFLAVPALQRNSRNTRVKNDVARLLAGARDYQATNNNAWPNQAQIVAAAGTLSTMDAANVTMQDTGPTTPTPYLTQLAGVTLYIPATKVVVYRAASCDGTNISSGAKAVVLYQVETAGTPTAQCTEG